MNNVILTGNIVRDVKLGKTKNNKFFLSNVIAVKDGYKTEYEKTYFINFECYSQEALKQFKDLKKGNLVEIQGKLVVESYKDKHDNWVNYTRIIVFKVSPVEFKPKEKEDAEEVDWDKL